MATEEKKTQNRARINDITLVGLTAAIWEFVGESALSLCNQMGEEILNVLEKEMGVEIAGEKPEDVLTEIGRVFVDELGFAKAIEVKREGNCVLLFATDSLTSDLPKMLKERGVNKYYISPAMNASLAALKRIGVKARADFMPATKPGEMIIKFDLL